jgi:DNA-binding NarL/FixJ family response regulator
MLNSHSPGMARNSRVFLVDDHPIVRQGLAMMIDAEDDLQVCGHAEEAQTALQAIVECKPDILIVDISLSGPDGLELVKHVRTVFAELPILVLSMHDEATYGSERYGPAPTAIS